jgi:uncharacterized protein (TIGR04255 family)
MTTQKNMNLSTELETDLVLSAAFEMRFSTIVPPEAVFGMLYPIVVQKYPHAKLTKLPIIQLPDEIRQIDSTFKYMPYYQFDIDTREIAIGPKTIQFSVQKPYTGWKQLQTFIIDLLPQFFDINLFEEIERTGLRFVNFMEQSLHSIANINFQIGNKQFAHQSAVFSVEIEVDEYMLSLQLVNNATIKTPALYQLKGSVIDIEIIKEVDFSVSDFRDKIEVILEESHQIEEQLFFEMLRPNFSATPQSTTKE